MPANEAFQCKKHTGEQGPAYIMTDRIYIVLLTSTSKIAEFDRLQPSLSEAEVEKWLKKNADKVMDREMNSV